MRAIVRATAVALLMFTGVEYASAISSFSSMTVEEVSALLSRAGTEADVAAASAKDAVADTTVIRELPLELTVADMVGKVYGVVNPDCSKKDCVAESRRVLRLTPEEDEGVLWLEADNGYRINYYGLVPDVSAMARFENGEENVSDFGYFFIFPYEGHAKADGVREQTDFCSSLLQEMRDIGLPMDLNTATDDLFEAVGDYNGSLVDVRLLDDRHVDGDGRFILILSVEPKAFTAADNALALALD